MYAILITKQLALHATVTEVSEMIATPFNFGNRARTTRYTIILIIFFDFLFDGAN